MDSHRSAAFATPITPDAACAVRPDRDYEKLLSCVHCGLCLSACPTYRELGRETDSPRGRLYLIRSFVDGRTPSTDALTEHLSLCLGCRACETACPSGVRYGGILEWGKTIVEAHAERTPLHGLCRDLVLNRLIPSPRLLRLAALALWAYQRSGVSGILRSAGLLPKSLARLDNLSPRMPSLAMISQVAAFTPATGAKRKRVGFLSGCIMSAAFGHVNRMTIELLSWHGCEVVTPRDQSCCGALHIHNGEREKAQELARATIEAFERAGVDLVVTNSAGCGSTMKEYGELLRRDPAFADRAADFSRRVRDISELLVELGCDPPGHAIPGRIVYDDACHLQHGQRITGQPRSLLRSIPGIELVPHVGSDECCGSAGIYNLIHRDLSDRLLDRKMQSIADTRPDIIVTGNPGCLIQLAWGARRAGLNARVVHTVELLYEAYGGKQCRIHSG